MWTEIITKAESYIFRLIGLFLGVGGCAALVLNNPPKELFNNLYGLVFLVVFTVMWVYSLTSIVRETAASARKISERMD